LFVVEVNKELQNDGMKTNEDAYLYVACYCEKVVEDAIVGKHDTQVDDMGMMMGIDGVDENLVEKDEWMNIVAEDDEGHIAAVKKEVNLFVFYDDIVLHSIVMLRVEEYEE